MHCSVIVSSPNVAMGLKPIATGNLSLNYLSKLNFITTIPIFEPQPWTIDYGLLKH